MEKKLLKKDKVIGVTMLLIASFIWGTAFVAQSVGMDNVGPFTFYAARGLIGAAVLVPVTLIMDRKRAVSKISANSKGGSMKMLLLGGILCGILLFVASMLQQIGIMGTTVGKSGFLTALYIVIVPVLGIFMKKYPSYLVWIAVGLALIGTALLSLSGDLTISTGDLYIIISALFFSIHIIVVSKLIPHIDGVKLSLIQLLVSGMLAVLPAVIMEKPDINSLLAAAFPILYAGIMSSGIAYTLQIMGQERLDETPASLIMSLESVFAMLAGVVVLGEVLSVREVSGAAILFLAVILAQLPADKFKYKKKDVLL